MTIAEAIKKVPDVKFTEISLDDERIIEMRFATKQDISEFKNGNKFLTVDEPIWVAHGTVLRGKKATDKTAIYSSSKTGEIFMASLKGNALNRMEIKEIKGNMTYAVKEAIHLPDDKENEVEVKNKEEKKIMAEKEKEIIDGVPTDNVDETGDLPTPYDLDNNENESPNSDDIIPPVLEELEAPNMQSNEPPPIPNGGNPPPINTNVKKESNDFTANAFSSNNNKSNNSNTTGTKRSLTTQEKLKREKTRKHNQKIRDTKRAYFSSIGASAKTLSPEFRQAQKLYTDNVRIIGFTVENERIYNIGSAEVYPDMSVTYTKQEMDKYIINSIFMKKYPDENDRITFYNSGKFNAESKKFLKSTVNIAIRQSTYGKARGVFVKNLEPFLALRAADRNILPDELESLEEKLKGVTQISYNTVPEVHGTMTQFKANILEDEAVAIGGVPAKYSIAVLCPDEELLNAITNKAAFKYDVKLIRKNGSEVEKSLITPNNYLPLKIRDTVDLVNDPFTEETSRQLTNAYFSAFTKEVTKTEKNKDTRSVLMSAKIQRLSEQGARYLSIDAEGKLQSCLFSPNPAERQLDGLFKPDSDGNSTVPASIMIANKKEKISTESGKKMYKTEIYSLTNKNILEEESIRDKTSLELPQYETIRSAIGDEFFEDIKELVNIFKNTNESNIAVDVYDLYDDLKSKEVRR